MKFSMNGFRRNLSDEVERLRAHVLDVLTDEHVEKDEITDAMNQIICMSNSLNCVYQKDDPDFTNMRHVEVELLEYDGEQAS
ncbi:hypothetical protein [Marinobacterium stanieri]|uniref:hypothetical protein n=1 Tax=Marinobacterium stanieri TaxID=49186 RepID=UPI000255A5D6|nr:hypothetical protein [Marinobacterium stanieri]